MHISDRCAVLAAYYTTGMTVALMGFVLEPLDCLLHCHESSWQEALQLLSCEAPGQVYSVK